MSRRPYMARTPRIAQQGDFLPHADGNAVVNCCDIGWYIPMEIGPSEEDGLPPTFSDIGDGPL
jgi:hypothetical protein